MYENMDVANYIIARCLENGHAVNNLKLQKLLYYANMYYMDLTGSALIKEKFEKWKFGPVSPKVYFNFRHLGKHNIQGPVPYMEFTADGQLLMHQFNEDRIKEDDKRLLEKIVELFGDTDRFILVNKTHEEPMWKEYEDQILQGIQNLEYSNEEILAYVRSVDGDKLPWKT